jgi:hypothetical protein
MYVCNVMQCNAMHVCMYVCMCICIYIVIYMHTNIEIYMCVLHTMSFVYMSQPGPSRRWVWMWSSQAWGHRGVIRPLNDQCPCVGPMNQLQIDCRSYPKMYCLNIANCERKPEASPSVQVAPSQSTSLPEQIQDALASWVGAAVCSIGHHCVDLMILFRCMWWASK